MVNPTEQNVKWRELTGPECRLSCNGLIQFDAAGFRRMKMSDALPNESAPASQGPATPTWIWGVVGAVVLIAMAAGAYAGYQAGQQSTIGQRCPTVYYPDETFWLVGAQITDRNGQVVL